MDGLRETLTIWLNPQLMGPLVLGWGLRLLAALLIYVIGRWVAKALARWVGRAITKADIDVTLSRFLSSIVYMVLIVFVVLTALSALGVNTTNFLAILGAAGLAVGLALKDSLSNFAAGVMLVFFRPFKLGDCVEAAGISGTVISIKIFNTILRTSDNRVITVPNALIYANTITNLSTEDTRRIDLVIGIGHDDDIARAKALIQGVLGQDDRILDEPPPVMMLVELGASSVDIAVWSWVNIADYSQVRSDLLEHIKRVTEADSARQGTR